MHSSGRFNEGQFKEKEKQKQQKMKNMKKQKMSPSLNLPDECIRTKLRVAGNLVYFHLII